jgi:site-specific recombinase XerD
MVRVVPVMGAVLMTTNAYTTSHTDAAAAARPMTPLRRRMIEDMMMRRLAPKTQAFYVRAVAMFATYFNASPDTLDYEDVRRFRLHLLELGHNTLYVNRVLTALRFFYRWTLQRSDASLLIPLAKEPPRKLRTILSREEVARLLAAARQPRDRCAMAIAYGAGLRSCELVKLKVGDVDSAAMTLRVEKSKGGRSRLAKLSPAMLESLRDHYAATRPKLYLFQSRLCTSEHLSARQFWRICRDAGIVAGIDKPVLPHMLRHAFATHLLEDGIDIRVIQVMLGHVKLETTAIYATVSPTLIKSVPGPLDRLPKLPKAKTRKPKPAAPKPAIRGKTKAKPKKAAAPA